MKFIFFGTPEVARETLEYLTAAGLRPAAVVTNPDAPKGRGQALAPSPVKVCAQELGVPVLTPQRLDEEFIKEVAAYGADLGIVAAYGRILPEPLLHAFPRGVLNIHYSLLPRWRGAAPVEHALLHDEAVTGVTIQKMARQLDAGDVLSSVEVPIAPEDTAASLRPRLIRAGAELLLRILPAYLAGALEPRPQDEAAATYAPKLRKADGLLDLSADDRANWNKYRAFAISPGTYFFENGRRLKIRRARFADDRFLVERVVPEGGRERDYRPRPLSGRSARAPSAAGRLF